MDTLPERGFSAGRKWVATPTASLSTPKGLNSIAVSCLAIAVLVLVAFVLYAVRKGRTRGAASRPKRGKHMPAMPQVEAEFIVDDPRRGGRAGHRRNLPAMLLDRVRVLSLVGGLWRSSPVEPQEKEPDEADVIQYSAGRPSGAGPRFLAATASGKALQVVVKTAALPAMPLRQQQRQELLLEHKSAPTPSPGGALLGAANTTPGTPVQGHESRTLDLLGAASPPFAAAAGATALTSGRTPGGEAGVAVRDGDTGAGSAEDAAGLGSSAMPYRHSYSAGSRTFGQGLAGGGGAGAPPPPSSGGGLGGIAGGQGAGRGGDVSNDPAAAWYSRALHRQVPATAIAAQLSGSTPKAHLA